MKDSILDSNKTDGIPILVHHGAPIARLLCLNWVENALAQGLQLTSYDRPGYGASTLDPGCDVASVAHDVAAIANSLDINRL